MELRKSFGDCFLVFFLVFAVFVGSSSFLVPVGKGEREFVSLCYGIFYGNAISMKSLQFFIDYYHKLGVERIVAFLHPSLNQSLSLFQETGLSITMWDSNYTFDKISHDQNHKRALEQCISSEINHFGATTIIVCDPDEFLYFDPEKYDSLHSFLKEFRDMKDVGQLHFSRWYYEIDLCSRKKRQTIWETPFLRVKKIDKFGKSIFFTDHFLGFTDKKFEHHFNVTGETLKMNHSKAHFKHFRRFLSWNGDCRVVVNRMVRYREKRDLLDPQQKDNSLLTYTFVKDEKLLLWRDFVENSTLPKREIERREREKRKEGERKDQKGEGIEKGKNHFLRRIETRL